jgi:predicted DNA-binding transcriptional regulator AlpA
MVFPMTAKTYIQPTVRALPSDLAAVALIDASTCAAVGDMSVSWWHEEVRSGRAPAPAIRKSRCTRWRMSDVRAYWIESADRAAADTQTVALVKAYAKKASAAAAEKRLKSVAFATAE